MVPAQIDAVVAGTRDFALALLAPLEARVGTRPRIATDPAHALVFCTGPGLVVVEYLGEDSLSSIKDLVLEGEGLRIVAAIPAAHAAAETPLRALGVDAVRWDGTAEGILAAVDRQLAAVAAPRPRPAAAPRAAPARTPPAPRPAAAGAPGTSRAAPAAAGPAGSGAPAPTPSRPSPAVAKPALTPTKPIGAVAVPRPAAGAPALTPSRAAPAVAKPALTPTKPIGAVAVPRPSPAAPPAPKPPAAKAAPAPSRPAPAAADALDGELDGEIEGAFAAAAAPTARAQAEEGLFDAFDPELLAAAESLGAPPPAAPSPAPPAVPVARAPAPEPEPSGQAPGLFDDLHDESDHEFDVDVDEGGPHLAAPPEESGAPWPTAVPDAIEAADALGRGLLGDAPPPGTPLAVVADVVAGLSDLERAVFSGVPQPIDTEPVRRAAVMRVRVAVALATAPAPGGAVDQGAVSAFLADIDALLSDVNALASEAPPEVQASLEAMRNALVKEAIDFSEAVQRAAPAEALPQPAPAARRAPPGVRVVSVATQGEIDLAQAEAKRQRRAYVLLGVVAVIAAIYHGYGYLERAKIARDERPTRSSAPPGAMVAPHGSDRAPVMVRSKDGAPFSAEELSRIQSEEALRGNLVRETSPGAVLILPQGGANGPPSPATR